MLTSVLPLLFVIGSIATLGLTGNLFSSSPFVIAPQVAAIGLGIWARRSFRNGAFRVTATPAGSSIIREGPYRALRHPMYSAALLLTWSGVVSHASVLTLAIGVAVTGLTIARVSAEERLLAARFADYPDYARSTKALVPFLL